MGQFYKQRFFAEWMNRDFWGCFQQNSKKACKLDCMRKFRKSSLKTFNIRFCFGNLYGISSVLGCHWNLLVPPEVQEEWRLKLEWRLNQYFSKISSKLISGFPLKAWKKKNEKKACTYLSVFEDFFFFENCSIFYQFVQLKTSKQKQHRATFFQRFFVKFLQDFYQKYFWIYC